MVADPTVPLAVITSPPRWSFTVPLASTGVPLFFLDLLPPTWPPPPSRVHAPPCSPQLCLPLSKELPVRAKSLRSRKRRIIAGERLLPVRAVSVILSLFLVFAHGCHGDEDTELFTVAKSEEAQANSAAR